MKNNHIFQNYLSKSTIVGLIVLSVLVHCSNVYLDYNVITYAAFLSAELVGIKED